MTEEPKSGKRRFVRKAPAEHALPRRGRMSEPTTPSQRFLTALEFVLRHEAGYGDPSTGLDQPTQYGITRPFHRQFAPEHSAEPISHVGPDEARRLYYDLWQRLGSDSRSLPDAMAYFDTAVLFGERDPLLADRPALPELLSRRERHGSQSSFPGHALRAADLRAEVGLRAPRRFAGAHREAPADNTRTRTRRGPP